MTKKEFFLQKIIPEIETQIWTYEYHLIRTQFILEELKKQLEEIEKIRIYLPQENPEQKIQIEKEKEQIKKQIEEAQKNLTIIPLLKAGEEKFLSYFKELVEKM